MIPAGITIRVVKPPTTGELLDAYYRERNMVHGSGSESDQTMPASDGCRRRGSRGGAR